MGVLSNLEPKEVFAYFEEICSIPHASYHEGRLSDYCAEFAKKHHLEYYQDDLKNIIIIKEASPGCEEKEPVIVQGHLDMVCEKEPGCDFNFETDGLKLLVEGDHITADGTTLGGDDGIAAAYALALLSSDTAVHPRLEIVLTVSEEVGMEGAAGIDVSVLKGRRLINLDSEDEGILLAGCAGGARAVCRLPVQRIPARGAAVKITVSGLAGGHSGTEIDKGRANADILLGRVLASVSKQFGYHLAAAEGGKKDNAIPRECSAVLCLAPEDCGKALQAVSKICAEVRHEYAVTDKNVMITAERMPGLSADMLDETSTRQAVLLLNALPCGVQTMSADVEGLVETSLNLGIMELKEKELVLHYALRSSVDSAKAALVDRLAYLTQGLGGTITVSGLYPAWEYRRSSPLRDSLCAVYEKMYGKKPVIEAIHAGLECGLLAGKIPGLDCISIGPDMQSIHTTEEKLSISSVRRVWEYLLEVLKVL